MKKAIAWIMALALAGALALAAAAQEWQGADFTFTLPQEVLYTFTRAVPSTDSSWALAGISDPSSTLQEYEDMGVIADCYTLDGLNFKVMEKEGSTAQSLWDLAALSQEELDDFLDNLVQARSEDISLEKSYLDINGQPFYRVRIDGAGEEGEAHELLIGTLFNGHTLTFDTYDTQPLSQEAVALLEQAAASARITQVLEKPEPEPANIALYLGVALLLVLVVLSPLVALPVRSHREKRRKARMAGQLAEYRRRYGDNPPAGEPLFVNETECTKEAVHEFSFYHAYRRGLPSLILGAVICAGALAAAFLFDLTWWLKLLAGGVAVYFLYQLFSMGGRVEKIQRAVFSRGVSSTARLVFYEEGFRVSGIQTAILCPYFQIVGIRRNGHYCYLYYGADNAYLVDQYGFTQGTWEDFLTFIREKTAKEKEGRR